MIAYSELSSEQIDRLNKAFMEEIRGRGDSSLTELYEAYLLVLATNNVMCPHPESMRAFHESGRWFDCSLCSCSVII